MKKKTFIIITCVMIILSLGTQVHAFSFGDAINYVLRAVGADLGEVDISKNGDNKLIAKISFDQKTLTIERFW